MDNETLFSLFLPQEIIEEILPRLPVKSLLRFRCVSKPWRSLISSERFTKIQFKNSTMATSLAYHGVILNSKDGYSLKQCSLKPLMDDPSLDHSPVYDPPGNHPKAGHVVGNCNGLLLIRHRGRFLLWNPAIRMTTKLPQARRSIFITESTHCGFGWDEASGAYKVIVIHCDRKWTVTEAYSSKTNKWRKLGRVTPSKMLVREGLLVGGKLHWLSRMDDNGVREIVTFDLKSEAFGKMEQPCVVETGVPCLWYSVWLKVVNGLLSVVDINKEGIDLWVMKKESWEKVIVIPIDYRIGGSVTMVKPLYIGSNGEFLLVYHLSLFVYRPDENRVSLPVEIRHTCAPIYGLVYIESLESPVVHEKLTIEC